jgi:hypothetical protein
MNLSWAAGLAEAATRFLVQTLGWLPFSAFGEAEGPWRTRIYTLHEPLVLRALLAHVCRRFSWQQVRLTLLCDGVSWIVQFRLDPRARGDGGCLKALLEEYAEVEPFEAQLAATFRLLEQGDDDQLRQQLEQCCLKVVACGRLSPIEWLLLLEGLSRTSRPTPPEQS